MKQMASVVCREASVSGSSDYGVWNILVDTVEVPVECGRGIVLRGELSGACIYCSITEEQAVEV